MKRNEKKSKKKDEGERSWVVVGSHVTSHGQAPPHFACHQLHTPCRHAVMDEHSAFVPQSPRGLSEMMCRFIVYAYFSSMSRLKNVLDFWEGGKR